LIKFFIKINKQINTDARPAPKVAKYFSIVHY
jgi:hypothetical protein